MSAFMTKVDDKVLSQRIHSRIDSLLSPSLEATDIAQIYCSSHDEGVIRNGGRFGARFGAQAIVSQLGKLISDQKLKNKKIGVSKISHWSDVDGFEEMEKKQIEMLSAAFKFKGRKVHLGGGHDHLYSLVAAAVKNGAKSLRIVNLDPHLDTRTDELSHSGNHLKRIANDFSKIDLKIFQIGTLREANDHATTTSVDQKIMEIIWRDDWSSEESWQKKLIEKIYPKDFKGELIISFDADMVEASEMQAVSAVAFDGIAFKELSDFIIQLDKVSQGKSLVGVYEYNPLYENLSCQGARKISYLLSKLLLQSSLIL
jgi:formiminoglutamase